MSRDWKYVVDTRSRPETVLSSNSNIALMRKVTEPVRKITGIDYSACHTAKELGESQMSTICLRSCKNTFWDMKYMLLPFVSD